MPDLIVVGSGPAGVSAALGFRPRRVLMLDVGLEAPAARLPDENLDLLRAREECSRRLLGETFESFHNVDRGYLSPKLKAPLMRFITAPLEGDPEILADGFAAVRSYARGGLANAWGAVVTRYDDRDLAGFPLEARDLAPYYDELAAHIGVSGAEDDLTSYYGTADGLQPPLPLSRLAARFLGGYERRRATFQQDGIRVGRLRSAILTREHQGRPAHLIHNQEFYQPNLRSIYHPGYTLDEMRSAGEIEYRPGHLVLRYREVDSGVEVVARNLATGELATFNAAHVVLAAGALNTARIVLASHDDHVSRLPVLDNLLSYVPLLDLRMIGATLDTESFSGGELAVVYEGPLSDQRIQAMFYGLAAPLKGDLFSELPLSARGNLDALRYLLPAMSMLQVFYPDQARDENYLRLMPDGRLQVHYERRTFGAVERHLIARFRRAGFLSATFLCQFPEPGSSMHYAGSLPMKDQPRGPYETDRFGRLPGAGRVRIADGAALPALASKNHTFTIMANAMRIARHLRDTAA